MNHYLVFDWGGTFLKYAYMDENTQIQEKGQVKTPAKTVTKEDFLSLLDTIVNRYEDINGIAISSPGIINSQEGMILVVGAFPYLQNIRLCEELSARYHVPVTIENDAKCAALAEVWKGNLSDCSDGIVFIIGTSIGGGIILDKKLRRGIDFFAGEFSSVCTDLYHPSERDSYMAQLGYEGLTERVRKYLELDHEISGEEAFRYINAGDEKALAALHAYTDLLAIELFNLNVLLDVEKICIGGGISKQPLLLESLKESVQKIRTWHPDIVGGIDLPLPQVDVCRFYNDANLIGALYHFFELEDNGQ